MKTEKFSLVAMTMTTLAMVTTTICLELRDVQEGSCRAIKDIHTLNDVHLTLIDVGAHLHFDELWEPCHFKNVSVEKRSGSSFGFGDLQLAAHDVRRGKKKDDTDVALVNSERSGAGIEAKEFYLKNHSDRQRKLSRCCVMSFLVCSIK